MGIFIGVTWQMLEVPLCISLPSAKSIREDPMNLDDLKNLPTPPPVGFQSNITQPLFKVKSEGDV